MAQAMGSPVPVPSPPQPRRAVGMHSWRMFYLLLAAVMCAVVLAGFWPSYFGALLRGTMKAHWIVHLHGAVFTGWMLLLVAQVVFAARGQLALHRKVGALGIGYGFLVLAMGLVVTFAAPTLHVIAGEWTRDQAAGFLILPIGDMVLFGGFFGLAVRYRNRPEVHKRLIVLATIALLFAPAARLSGENALRFLAIWFVPLVIAIGHDVWARKRVHPVYAYGTLVLLVAFTRIFAMESETWLRLGRPMIDVFTQNR